MIIVRPNLTFGSPFWGSFWARGGALGPLLGVLFGLGVLLSGPGVPTATKTANQLAGLVLGVPAAGKRR